MEGNSIMKNQTWWTAGYIDQKAWIIEHIADLKLSPDALILILVIIHHQHKNLNLNVLSQLSNMSVKTVDQILNRLVQDNRLTITVSKDQLFFDLSPLFQLEAVFPKDQWSSLIHLYEQEFKRPLSSHEVEKLQDWLTKLDASYLVHALREAVIYQKLNFSYIDKILISWINKDISLEALNSGHKHG